MNNVDTNVLSTVFAIVCTGTVTYLVNRFGKSADARGAAEAALLGIGPAIIEEQNKRIAQLNEQIERLWVRDHECRKALETATARILILEQKTYP